MTLEPLAGLKVVDLFAGSGALGIEALSRGALHVDFVESSGRARTVLRSNLDELGLDGRSTVWALDLPQGLKRMEGPIAVADLILLDPPYGGETARATLAVLGERVGAESRVVVEHHAKDELPERAGRLHRTRQRQYGETAVSIYAAQVDEPHTGGEEEVK